MPPAVTRCRISGYRLGTDRQNTFVSRHRVHRLGAIPEIGLVVDGALVLPERESACSNGSIGCQHPKLGGVTDRSDPMLSRRCGGAATRPKAGGQGISATAK
jgi:hypothetical protein